MDKCNTYLDIVVNDVKKMLITLEKDLHLTKLKVYPDQHIHLYEGFEQTAKISKAAVLNEIELRSINSCSVNLENYYMNMIGGMDGDSLYNQ